MHLHAAAADDYAADDFVAPYFLVLLLVLGIISKQHAADGE